MFFQTNKHSQTDPEVIESSMKRDQPAPSGDAYPDLKFEKIKIEENGLSVSTLHVKSITTNPNPSDQHRKIVLYFHGGGFVSGSPNDYIELFANLVRKTNCEIFAPDYRKGPKYKYPSAQEDAWECYQHILKMGG